MKVYLNGRVLEEGEAVLPLQDRGVLFGDGIFETIRAYAGQPFRLDRHLARLRRGCEALRLPLFPEDAEFAMAISHLYQENVGRGDAYVRITLTGGAYDGSKDLTRPGTPTLFVVVKPFEGYPDEYYTRGMRMAVTGVRRNSSSPLSRIKSNNYLDTLIAKQEARDRGADDAIFLNEQGHLAEASTANLFWVRNRGVFTPEIGCGLLPGITREAVVELCGGLEIACKEGCYLLGELTGADEVFISVSTGEVVPVSEVNGRKVGHACPGAVTSRLAEAYCALVREELGLM
jgi:branched-chain amino acid aminotransferase